MLGLKRGTVKLTQHHDEWARLFEKEKQVLLETFEDLIIAIEHVGSTAIPNIPAKPIIDMNVAISSLDDRTVEIVNARLFLASRGTHTIDVGRLTRVDHILETPTPVDGAHVEFSREEEIFECAAR